MIEKYQKYTPFLLLLIYSCSYLHHIVYYDSFWINIPYYINLSDLVFYGINVILGLFILLLVTKFILYIITHFVLVILLNLTNKKSDNAEEVMNKKIDDNYFFSYLIILFLLTLLFAHFTQEYVFSLSMFFALFIIEFFIFIIKDKRQDHANKKPVLYFLWSAFVLLLLLINIISGFQESSFIKTKKNQNLGPELSFSLDGVAYSTKLQKDLVLAGETSNYIFLYNKLDKKTLIFHKDKITNLIIYDQELSEEEMKKMMDNSIKQLKSKLTKIVSWETK